MSDLEGFDPKDMEELEAIARRIERDHDTMYELTLVVSLEGALDFFDKYGEAADGDVRSFLDMMMIVHAIAKSLDAAVRKDED